MVEKGSDHSSDKSPSTPEQGVQRSCSSQSGRSGGKNSKVSGTLPGDALQGSQRWGGWRGRGPLPRGPWCQPGGAGQAGETLVKFGLLG